MARSSVTGPGPDGLWHTEDDVLDRSSERITYVYDEVGNSCETHYTPGPDQRFDTEDDILDRTVWTRSTYVEAIDAHHYETATTLDVGPDGLPCTDDDSLTPFRFWNYESEDRRRTYTRTSPYIETWLDEANRDVRSIVWNQLVTGFGGPDVDQVLAYTETERSAYGGVRQFRGNGPGRDLIWFNADDDFDISEPFQEFDPVSLDLVTGVTYGTGAALQGGDGVWGTRDDNATLWERRSAGAGYDCLVAHDDRGADLLWDETDCGNGAGDDHIARVDWREFDDAGVASARTASPSPTTMRWRRCG